MNETAQRLVSELSKSLLEHWEKDEDLDGGFLVLLSSSDSLEVDVRKAGATPEFAGDEYRACLMAAAETADSGWSCRPAGLGYPLRHEENLLGVCILFPARELEPLLRWQDRANQFARQIGPLLATTNEEPPSLQSLAEAIPECAEPAEEAGRKLHWETSQARLEVPVHEELANHLLLDRMPLF